jgi:hypothetical protein
MNKRIDVLFTIIYEQTFLLNNVYIISSKDLIFD